MRAVIGIRNIQASTIDRSRPTLAAWFDSMRQMAGVLSDENRDLVRLSRSSGTRAVRPEVLATEFLIALD